MKNLSFLPTSPLHFGCQFHVAKNGSDVSGDGSLERPFQTISHAAEVIAVADTVVVHEGVYRETVHLRTKGHPYCPEAIMRFVAAEGERVWIRGSEVFEAEWRKVGGDIWSAVLPKCFFVSGAYNPFAQDIDFNNPQPVRPGGSAVRGQFWIDDQAGLSRSLEESLVDAGDFHISEDGHRVEMRFPAGIEPASCQIEISVRKQCFESDFSGTAFYEVIGIDVGHAVEPGAFDGPRRRIVHRNAASGITVQRDFAAPPSGMAFSIPFSGQMARLADNTLLGAIFTPTVSGHLTLDSCSCVESKGNASGTRWKKSDKMCPGKLVSFFHDRTDGRLYNFWAEHEVGGMDPFSSGEWNIALRVSDDEGATWSEKMFIPAVGEVAFDMLRLMDGTLLLPATRDVGRRSGGPHHSDFHVILGQWENGVLKWRSGQYLHVDRSESEGGLDEPHVAQLADGRLVVFLRSGSRLPTETDGRGGVTSGKLVSVSTDNGMTWRKPEFLRYDDGGVVYSPRSYQDLFVSEKNGRLYAILNIAQWPAWNCDPRNRLQIAEIDMDTLRLKRTTITEIEGMHEQHHDMVRYSNWRGTQDANGDMLIFLELGEAEQCPIRCGYDRSMYCYRIILPD